MELIVKNPAPPRLSVGMSVWLWDDLRQDVSFGTVKCLSEFTPVRDGKPVGPTRRTVTVEDGLTGKRLVLDVQCVWTDEAKLRKTVAAARGNLVVQYKCRMTSVQDVLAACLAHDMTRTDTPERAILRAAVLQRIAELGIDPGYVQIGDPFPEIEE